MSYSLVFCGTPLFAVPSLRALHDSTDFSVGKVFTQPDRPSGRGKKLKASPVKSCALELGLTVETPEKVSSSEIVEELRQGSFDLAVVVAYGQLLSQDFLDSFQYGCVNIHSSLLPRWRGAAPMQRAIMAGDTETGVSLQKIVKKLDAGDVIAEKKISLPLRMGSTELYQSLSHQGAELLLHHLVPFMKGESSLQKQDESLVTYAKKINKHEGQIDWSLSALEVHNKVRGLDMGGPYAFTSLKQKVLKIHKTSILEESFQAPHGQIMQVSQDSLVVACGQGALKLERVQPESKAKMDVADFIRGYPVAEGDRFE